MAVTPFKSSDNFNMSGFNEKITEADNTYVAKTGDSMSGALSMGNNKITDVASPTSAGDVVNKGYVDKNIDQWELIGSIALTEKVQNISAQVQITAEAIKLVQESRKIKAKVKISGSQQPSQGNNTVVLGKRNETKFVTIAFFTDMTSPYSVEKEFVFFNAYDNIRTDRKITYFQSDYLTQGTEALLLTVDPIRSYIEVPITWGSSVSGTIDVNYEISLYRTIN